MGGEWRESTIGELIENGKASLQTGPFGTALKAAEYSSHGVPLISVGEIREGYLQITEDTPRVDKATTQRLPKFVLREGDIVFGRKGAVDRNARISKEQDGWFLGSDGIRLRVSDEYDSDFLSYQMRSSLVRNWLLQNSAGTTMLSLNQKVLSLVRLVLPDLETQRGIGSILRTLDDKIEVNRTINRTLEAMAQAIFKSWFVDFDPVKAKMAARESGNDPTRAAMAVISGKSDTELDAFQQQDPKSYERLRNTAQAFPDALVDSELGMIPEGWDVKPLDKVANYLNGLALQNFPPESESEWLPVIKIAQLKKGDSEGADRASANIKPEYIIDDGDVIFSWSGSLEVEVWCGGKGALNQHLFKVTSVKHPKWFYFHWTKHHLGQFKQIAADKAVTMGHIKRGHLSEALCAVPDDGFWGKAGSVLEHIMAKQMDLLIQIRTLSILRETLLPELLSGVVTTRTGFK